MKRIAIIVLTGLVAETLLLTSCGIPQDVQQELDALRAEKTQWDETLMPELEQLRADKTQWVEEDKPALEQQVADLEDQITDLEQEIADLNAEMECLRQPPLGKIEGEIVGTVTLEELVQLAQEFFPNATGFSIGAFSGSSDYPLTSLDTCKEFLAEDITDWCPQCYETSYNPCIERAFTLKFMWLEYAHLPTFSLGLVQTREGYWLNIFITRENGELAIYKVDPGTDRVTKLEGPDLDVVYYIIRDRV
jgi:hypothetical protein